MIAPRSRIKTSVRLKKFVTAVAGKSQAKAKAVFDVCLLSQRQDDQGEASDPASPGGSCDLVLVALLCLPEYRESAGWQCACDHAQCFSSEAAAGALVLERFFPACGNQIEPG
jgi:hypothetical protein